MTGIFDTAGIISEAKINRTRQKKLTIIEATGFQFDQSKLLYLLLHKACRISIENVKLIALRNPIRAIYVPR